jgi:large subunit ribosomal protein L21
MYAIVKTGGKQYRVEQGQSLLVERLPASDGESVQLQPLLFVDGSSVVDDATGLAGVTVAARVVGHERGPKLRIVKFKPKRGYKRRTGHRQELTRIEVTEISSGSRPKRSRSRKAASKEEPAAEAASAPTPAATAEAPATPAPEAAQTPAATAEAEVAPEQSPEAASSPDEAPVTPATTTPEEETDGA